MLLNFFQQGRFAPSQLLPQSIPVKLSLVKFCEYRFCFFLVFYLLFFFRREGSHPGYLFHCLFKRTLYFPHFYLLPSLKDSRNFYCLLNCYCQYFTALFSSVQPPPVSSPD